MADTTKPTSTNKTLLLMRRLAADKQETKRQLREAFTKDTGLKRTIADLDKQYAEQNS